jgi:DNA modification methylase
MPDSSRPELTWSGKYDDQGNVRPGERTILPFQVVEAVNESKADREASQRDFFTKQAQDKTWRNRLIWGDNKIVMSSLLPELAGKIDLIYIDPPFATGSDFSFKVQVGDEEFIKSPSVIEEKAYRDTWGRGLDSYLQMMYERLVLMHQLLSERGSLFVHIDWRVGAYLRSVLDEVFGAEGFVQEIIWQHQIMGGAHGRSFPKAHETVLWYARTEKYLLRIDDPNVRVPFSKYVQETLQQDEEGRWFYTRRRMSRKATAEEAAAKAHTVTYVEDPSKGTLASDVWSDMLSYQALPSEQMRFPTQKPEALLRRIVSAASEEGSLVADFFCGSGTTLAVAEKLGRRWVGCDLSKWAFQTTRKRLLQVENCRPFELQNLGHYERHKLASNGHGAWERYTKFILDLYRAEPVTGFKNLHGKKARAYVHVGSVDSPVTMREIRAALEEAQKNGAKEVHFLGWDFEMGIHDLTAELQDEYGVKARLVSIPKEALEVGDPAKEQVRFFDLNYLEVEHEGKGKKLTVALKDFIIANPEYLPDEVRERIKKCTDYVDYWAVDWDYQDDTFHNQWQSFRTRKEPKLGTKASYTYEKAGKYKVLVKVVDVFGNDTTKMIEVTVK